MFIQFSKDINKIKSTIIWIFTLRDIVLLLGFGIIGVFLYFTVKDNLSFEASSYVLCAFMVIPSILIFYNKNGMKAEKVLYHKFKRIFFTKIRPYKSENIYSQIECEIKKQEVNRIAVSEKSKKQGNIHKKIKK